MAAAAAVEVHHRPEAVGNVFGFVEVVLPLVEERELIRGQSRKRTSDIGRPAAHARVTGDEIDGSGDLRMEKEEACYRREQQWHCVPDLHTTSHPRFPQRGDRKEARGEQRAARPVFVLPRRSSIYIMYLFTRQDKEFFLLTNLPRGATKLRTLSKTSDVLRRGEQPLKRIVVTLCIAPAIDIVADLALEPVRHVEDHPAEGVRGDLHARGAHDAPLLVLLKYFFEFAIER